MSSRRSSSNSTSTRFAPPDMSYEGIIRDPHYECYRQEYLQAIEKERNQAFPNGSAPENVNTYNSRSGQRRPIQRGRGIMKRSRSEIILPNYVNITKELPGEPCECVTCVIRSRRIRHEKVEKNVMTFAMRLFIALLLSYVLSWIACIVWENISEYFPIPKEPTFTENMLYYIHLIGYFLSYFLAKFFAPLTRRLPFF